jgi:hypothetical protein
MAEGLPHLAHLAPLKMADLGGESLERRPRDGDGREQLGVAVPMSDLRRCRLDSQAQPIAHERFDLGWSVRIGAHRAGDLADRHGVPGMCHPLVVAGKLERPIGQLETERGGLRPDPVGTSHHVGRPVLERLLPHDVEERGDPAEEQAGCLSQQNPVRSVQHVR